MVQNIKRIITLLIFTIGICNSAFSQGNLQFNQVIQIEYTGSQLPGASGYYAQMASQTVNIPVGKVWKIESINSNVTKGTLNTASGPLLLNYSGVPTVYIDNALVSSSLVSTAWVVPHQIYWLPAGNHTFSTWLPTTAVPSTVTNTTTITVIEFNVVP